MSGTLVGAENKYNFFRSCYVGENKYSIGDFVFVKKPEEPLDDARVVRVEACCDRGSKYGKKRIVVFATRFLRKGDVPRLHQDMRELVMDTSKQRGSEMVHASDIQYACQVEVKDELKHGDSTSFYYSAGYDGKTKCALSSKELAVAFQFRAKSQPSTYSLENRSLTTRGSLIPDVSTPGTTRPFPLSHHTATGNDTDSQSDDLDDIFSEKLWSEISIRRAAKASHKTARSRNSAQPATRARRLGNSSRGQSAGSKLHAAPPTPGNGRREGARNMIEPVDYGGDTPEVAPVNQNPYDFPSDDQSPLGKPLQRRRAGLRKVTQVSTSTSSPTKRSKTPKELEKSTKDQQKHSTRKKLPSKRNLVSTLEALVSDGEDVAAPKQARRKEGTEAREQPGGRRKSRLRSAHKEVTQDVCVPPSTSRSLRQRTGASQAQKELREDAGSDNEDEARKTRSTGKGVTLQEDRVLDVSRSVEAQTRADIIRSKLRTVVKEQSKTVERQQVAEKGKAAMRRAAEREKYVMAELAEEQPAEIKADSSVQTSKRSVRQRNTAVKKQDLNKYDIIDHTEEGEKQAKTRPTAARKSKRYQEDAEILADDSDPEISFSRVESDPPTTSRSSRRCLRNIKMVKYCSDHDDDSDVDESFKAEINGEDDSSDEGSDSHQPHKQRGRSGRKSAARSKQRAEKTSGKRRSLAACTPSVPSRSQPVLEGATALERARAQLHVSVVPDSLPCRDEEFANILGYVESKLEGGSGGCLYISGVPGTGKTATVFEVIRYLEQRVSEDQLPSFTFISINGMRLTQPHQAFVQVYKRLTGKKVTADHATSLLDAIFCKARRQESIVLLVDELDLLMTRKQDVLYNLFDWPTKPRSKLIVLAIANTMDLPERVMMNRVSSRLGLNRMTFQPYSFQQLQQIVHSRLADVLAFDPDAVQLASRKVAAVSGDARRALDICRRSTEVAEKSGAEMVSMQHVNEALQEMFSSPKITAIRSCSYYEKIILRAIIAEFTRSGLEEATLYQVFRHVDAICAMDRMPSIKMVQMMQICSNLNNIKLLLLECNGKGIYQRVRLNVGQDDVQYALRDDKS